MHSGFGNMLLHREMSKDGALRFLDIVQNRRLRNLELSTAVELQTTARSPTNCLALEKIEYRYLLSGSLSGTISLYDLEGSMPATGQKSILQPLLQHAQTTGLRGTAAAVASLQWYPEDSGAFLSAHMNGHMSIFDTNYFAVVSAFTFDQVMYSARMRSDGNESPLIAVALQDGTIRLCDPRTRDTSHILKGHDRPVTSIDWCPSVGSAHTLASAGMDGAVRIWDVRRAGSVADAVVRSLDWRGDFVSSSKVDTRKLYTSLSSVPSRGSHSVITDASQPYRPLRDETQMGESSLRAGRAHDGGVMSMRYTSCGNFVVTSGNDQRLRMWEAHTGKLVQVNYSDNIVPVSQLPYDIGIAELSYASADILLVPAGGNCTVSGGSLGVEGDVRTTEGDILMIPAHSQDGQPIKLLKGHLERVTAITYRKPHQQVVSAARDGMVFLWSSPKSQRQSSVESNSQAEGEERESKRQHRMYFSGTGARYDFQQVLSVVDPSKHRDTSSTRPNQILRRPQLLPVNANDDTEVSIHADGFMGVAKARAVPVDAGSDESGDDWSDSEIVTAIPSVPLKHTGKRRKISATEIVSAAKLEGHTDESPSSPDLRAQRRAQLPEGRSFVPPIFQRYLHDASRDTRPAPVATSSGSSSNIPSIVSSRGSAQWSAIDSVFEEPAAPVRAVTMDSPPMQREVVPSRSTTTSTSSTNKSDNRTADQRYAQWLKQMRSKGLKKK